MSRAEELYGAKDPDALFKGKPGAMAPWPAATRRKHEPPYDKQVVEDAVRQGVTEKVDPRFLHASQPNVTRAGVEHYMSGSKGLYADQHQAGNRHPVVYEKGDRKILLSGTHRATTALLRGEQFDAVVAR